MKVKFTLNEASIQQKILDAAREKEFINICPKCHNQIKMKNGSNICPICKNIFTVVNNPHF